ncbi:putative DOMON domain-containing protein [Seiridium cardinale]
MRYTFVSVCFAALAALNSHGLAADSAAYRDPETDFLFSQYAASYAIGKTVTFRIAIPSTAMATVPYGAVLQVYSPIELGWTGVAGGGTMVTNPLTVAWANENTAVVTARWATGHATPTVYTGAALQVLKTGTHTNGIHWLITVKCAG